MANRPCVCAKELFVRALRLYYELKQPQLVCNVVSTANFEGKAFMTRFFMLDMLIVVEASIYPLYV